MDKEALVREIDALYAKATKGPWSMHKPGCCRSIDYNDGVVCMMMNNKVNMQDATGHAPMPEQAIVNQQFIVSLVNAWPQIRDMLERDVVPANSVICRREQPAPAWLVVYANGKRKVVLSPLTDKVRMDEGDEAWALYREHEESVSTIPPKE